MRTRWLATLLPAALVCSLASTSRAATAASTARVVKSSTLAYIGIDGAYVDSYQRAQPRRLPNSRGATYVSLNRTGVALYGAAGTKNVSRSDPPYRAATKLAIPPTAPAVQSAAWLADAKTVVLRFSDGSAATLDTKTTAYKVMSKPTAALSADGRVRASLTDEMTLTVEDGTNTPSRPVFTRTERSRLLDALRAQGTRQALDIVRNAETSAQEEGNEWFVGPPAVSADGEALYWTSNLGEPTGAAGNTSWVVMKTDVANGRTIGLVRYGPQFGRLPDLAVSSDGRKLLLTWSNHGSAFENPVANVLLDLASQSGRRFVNLDAPDDGSNVQWGQCLSADGRYFAYSAFYYSVGAAVRGELPDEPGVKDHTVFVKDATTGTTLRTIRTAVAPACA